MELVYYRLLNYYFIIILTYWLTTIQLLYPIVQLLNYCTLLCIYYTIIVQLCFDYWTAVVELM